MSDVGQRRLLHSLLVQELAGAGNQSVPFARLRADLGLGAALGLAIFSALATSRTNHLLAAHIARPAALTSGFQRGLLACSIFLFAAAVIALPATNTRGEPVPRTEPEPESVSVSVSDAA